VAVKQHDIFFVGLGPTIGREIKKTRPCVILSPDEMNQFIRTVLIAPVTSKSRDYPTRVAVRVRGREGWIMLDQIRTVDKRRLRKKVGSLDYATIFKVKEIIREMLVE
jgi:mRNA interferase MazF